MKVLEQSLLRAKKPVIATPMRRRRNAMKNWESLATAGWNGVLAAACQTSSNEESIC